MMMKKTTSALAVAALLGTGAASAATFQVDDDTSFGVSANIQFDYVVDNDANGNSETTVQDNSSDFRFEGESVADNGLTTMLYLEVDGLGVTDAENNNAFTTDQAFIGVGGDFGTVRVGSDLGTYGAVDGLKDLDNTRGVVGLGNDADQNIRYDFPQLGNLSAAVAASYNDDQSGGTKSGTSLNGSLTYDIGGVSLSAAYDNQGGQADDADGAFYGFGAQTTIAGVDTRVTYETETDDSADAGEYDLMSLTGVYSVAGGSLYGTVQTISGDDIDAVNNATGRTVGEDSATEYVIGYSYGLTENSYVLVETGSFDAANDEDDFVSVSFGAGF